MSFRCHILRIFTRISTRFEDKLLYVLIRIHTKLHYTASIERRTHMQSHAHLRIHARTCACTCTYIHINICVCVCVCTQQNTTQQNTHITPNTTQRSGNTHTTHKHRRRQVPPLAHHLMLPVGPIPPHGHQLPSRGHNLP